MGRNRIAVVVLDRHVEILCCGCVVPFLVRLRAKVQVRPGDGRGVGDHRPPTLLQLEVVGLAQLAVGEDVQRLGQLLEVPLGVLLLGSLIAVRMPLAGQRSKPLPDLGCLARGH